MAELRWFRRVMTMDRMREHGLIGTPYDYGHMFPPVLQYRAANGEWLDVPSEDEQRATEASKR
jgi:hypothetical protein